MIEREKWGKVQALHQGKDLLGIFPPVMTVRCYAVDGLMIDSGLHCFSRRVGDWAKELGIHTTLITHHHEDHSGNSLLLQGMGVEVISSSLASEFLARGFVRPFYQRVVWDKAPQAKLKEAPAVIETERHRFEVIPAPGHCEDQVILYERNEGWIFSGDAFLSSKVKYFRGDEDFHQTVQTLQRICKLSFDKIFCAHHPVFSQGERHFKAKLDYLLYLEEKVKKLSAQGLDLAKITHRVLGRENIFLYTMSWGDFSKRNLIRSILEGPSQRKDLKKIQEHYRG